MVGFEKERVSHEAGRNGACPSGHQLYHVLPGHAGAGDPVRQMIAGNEDIVVSQIEIDALRHELGLDKPFVFSIWTGWDGCFTGISAIPS